MNAGKALASHFPLSTNGATSGKLYEAWLMLEIGITLRGKGWAVDWIDPSQIRPSTMTFRGAPGSLSPRSPKKPGYLRLRSSDYELEMHNSLQYLGISGTLHEMDISILPADYANVCRKTNARPQGLPFVALELKHYAGDLSIGLCRSMLMALNDLALCWSNRQEAGRVMQWSRGKEYARIGNVDSSITYLFTTSEKIGATQTIASFYGAGVRPRVDADGTRVPGHHPEIDRLCDEITGMFR
ncbi:hypothetical protein [Agrobacterium sp. P15N1-A]|uniref:hypothetical protein n=1 Tax=Agrobacterium sp. P15N1-A TaxID=3342820 RepID=UPI0037D80D91